MFQRVGTTSADPLNQLEHAKVDVWRPDGHLANYFGHFGHFGHTIMIGLQNAILTFDHKLTQVYFM